MSEAERVVPAAGAPEETVSWDMFLLFLTAYGLQGADNPLVWEVLDELGLAERNAFTGAEMLAIEKAILAKVQLKLACSNEPAARLLNRVVGQTAKIINRHTAQS